MLGKDGVLGEGKPRFRVEGCPSPKEWRLDKMVEELKTIEVGFTDYIAARQKEFDWFRQGKEQGYEVGLKQGLEQGIEKGREQGAYEKALKTAKMFLSYGDSPEKVAICTQLPLDVVQELVQKQ